MVSSCIQETRPCVAGMDEFRRAGNGGADGRQTAPLKCHQPWRNHETCHKHEHAAVHAGHCVGIQFALTIAHHLSRRVSTRNQPCKTSNGLHHFNDHELHVPGSNMSQCIDETNDIKRPFALCLSFAMQLWPACATMQPCGQRLR